MLLQIDVPKTSIGGDNATYSGWAPGSIFSYGFKADEGQFRTYGSGTFNLNKDGKGDTLLTYCLNADGLPHFLNGFSFAGNWSKAGLTADQYGTAKSALPSALAEQGNVALPVLKNYFYVGPTEEFKADLIVAYGDPNNYNGSNTVRATIPALDSGASRTLVAVLGVVTSLLVVVLL